MVNNSSLGTVNVDRIVPCPPSCRWHGTDVLHARHHVQVAADVLTLEEACRRLGLSPKFQWDGLRASKVIFNDRHSYNHYVGMSKALFTFGGVYCKGKGFMPSSAAYAVVENPDGSIEAVAMG